MNLKTLIRWKRYVAREATLKWIAWHLPRKLVYWCAIRVAAHATTGSYSNQIVTDLRAMDALDRWWRVVKDSK